MGWEIGYDSNWARDIGYGVPAVCDHPNCEAKIDRGLGYVCGAEPYGGEIGCGLFFCGTHLLHGEPIDPDANDESYDAADAEAWAHRLDEVLGYCFCERCLAAEEPFAPKPDVKEWVEHKQTDPSWAEWRAKQVAA